MARRRSNRAMVPGSEQGLGQLKAQVMKDQGYNVNPDRPDLVKYEVARTLGVPLQPGYNGQLRAEDAGKIGGPIGGAMVRELVRMAQQQLLEQQPRQ
ncbi:alpha/beta-type small acid-soluble spore protein [Paenibacillus sp. SYP-B3998]|uniref:Alpha/beta-type small acid-soluble spore protein n=1 Tax=Paenibacillus sp. SYP-B3998 TaxID=2678564 RepID=A0A6G3ZY90_9BACL|nr:alpha/beta-type small acid-soluble spore protein [Paenibacillus sp. SYP-B3998]NEW07186.1 alpha/beta-type small acid-soluble spore protein [Paenibacillus sp. SYP-B3998]